METMRQSRPDRQKVTDEELLTFVERGLSAREMSRQISVSGRSITPQAINKRLRSLRGDRNQQSNRLLPWPVRAKHARDTWIYTAALAYAKVRRGVGVNPQQQKLALELQEKLAALGCVMFYDPRRGFVLRDRRPTDTAALVER